MSVIDIDEISKASVEQEVKRQLIKSSCASYEEFIGTIRSLPNSQLHLHQALARFDEGFFWLQQSILNSQIKAETVSHPTVLNAEGAVGDVSVDPSASVVIESEQKGEMSAVDCANLD